VGSLRIELRLCRRPSHNLVRTPTGLYGSSPRWEHHIDRNVRTEAVILWNG